MTDDPKPDDLAGDSSEKLAIEHGFTSAQWRAAKSIEMRIFGPYQWQTQGDRAASMFVAIMQAIKDAETAAESREREAVAERDEWVGKCMSESERADESERLHGLCGARKEDYRLTAEAAERAREEAVAERDALSEECDAWNMKYCNAIYRCNAAVAERDRLWAVLDSYNPGDWPSAIYREVAEEVIGWLKERATLPLPVAPVRRRGRNERGTSIVR